MRWKGAATLKSLSKKPAVVAHAFNLSAQEAGASGQAYTMKPCLGGWEGSLAWTAWLSSRHWGGWGRNSQV